jgi:hypothetical protein
MLASAIVLCILGAAATFVPDTILRALGAPASPALVVVVQLLGAADLGLAMLDWTAQHNLIGGIYSRPVAIGNLLNFAAGGLALVKALPRVDGAPAWAWAIAAAYILLAAWFGAVMFRHPIRQAISQAGE